MRIQTLLAAVLAFGPFCTLRAWDYEGHRTVNLLALTSLPKEFPSFVLEPAARERIGFLAGEPDRWRNASDLPLRHYNSPDHYIDMEELTSAGLKLEDLSEFRYVVTAQFAEARAAHADNFPRIDPEKNKDHTRELLGYLPWAIVEYYGKLKSAFSYLKTFEELGTPDEIANARANVIYIMGVMGHYVGDGSQPLHTTTRHNGWVGENPHGYTTSNRFHSWIDGGFLAKTGPLSVSVLAQQVKPAALLPATVKEGHDPIFRLILAYLNEQHAKVEMTYEFEKAGKFTVENPGAAEGRKFLEEQIAIAANMLGSLWLTAWREAPPDTYLHTNLLQRKSAAAK